jgi:hypothetical protein
MWYFLSIRCLLSLANKIRVGENSTRSLHSVRNSNKGFKSPHSAPTSSQTLLPRMASWMVAVDSMWLQCGLCHIEANSCGKAIDSKEGLPAIRFEFSCLLQLLCLGKGIGHVQIL